MLPAERGQPLEPSLTLTRRLCTLSRPGALCTEAAAGGGAGPEGRTLVLPRPPCLAWTRTLLGPREACGFSCSGPPGHPRLRSLGGPVERVWSPCPGAALDSPLHLGP